MKKIHSFILFDNLSTHEWVPDSKHSFKDVSDIKIMKMGIDGVRIHKIYTESYLSSI
jgi:hypothetical protein